MKYPWAQRLWQFRDAPTPAPLLAREAAYDFAAVWVEEWADLAERHGWQPAHLMAYPHGLAWRVRDQVVRRFHGHSVVLAGRWFNNVYEARKDGVVERLTGKRRTWALNGAGLPSAAVWAVDMGGAHG